MSKWLKKEDKVLVITGNDKGRTGVVLARKGSRLIVQGVNIRKKHLKRRDQNTQSEIIDIETPIHISNVQHCTPDGKPVKIKVKQSSDGSKELYYMDDGKEVPFRTLKKAK